MERVNSLMLNFVDYHREALMGQVDVKNYEYLFSKPLSSLFEYTGADLSLAVELFGPYLAGKPYGYIHQEQGKHIRELLFPDELGFDLNSLIDFFTENCLVSTSVYDVRLIQGYIIVGRLGDVRSSFFGGKPIHVELPVDCYYLSSFSWCNILQDYMFYAIYDAYMYTQGVSDLYDIINDDVFVKKLVDTIKRATFSYTNCCFYKHMFYRMFSDFLLSMGDDRINEREIMFGYDVDFTLDNLRLTNKQDITYGQLFDRLRPGLNY